MGRRTLIWSVAAVALLVSFFGGFELHSRSMAPGEGTPSAQAATIRAEVIETLEQSYYRPLSGAALRADNVRGVLGALDDPYTEYLPPAAYRQLLTGEQSSYAGIGAALAPSRHGLLVTATLPKLAAAAAGVRQGDVITAIDGRAIESQPYPRRWSGCTARPVPASRWTSAAAAPTRCG